MAICNRTHCIRDVGSIETGAGKPKTAEGA